MLVNTVVFVINKNGNKLMPCSCAKARKLIKQSKCKIVNHKPFTIQLTWDCEENTQEVILGIDKGSSKTGFCAITKNKVLISGIINHRTDIKNKMQNRANNRRQRRSRLWYRKKRFNNRASSKKNERVLPSIKANIEEVIRVVKKLPIPIHHIIVEDVLIDIAKLNNPVLTGKDYQKSNRLDENLRLACLLRDNFTCKYCNSKNAKLNAHHIVHKSNNGKDTITNLITLCEVCHKKLHKGLIKLDIQGVSSLKDVIAQRTMQGKTYFYKILQHFGDTAKIFGYQTAEYRKSLNLEKDHDIDAFCIANYFKKFNIQYNKSNFFNINFRPRQTRRCYFDLPRKGKGRVKYKVNEELQGFKKGDIVLVKNKFVKQINSIYSNGRVAFKRVKGEPASVLVTDCKILLKQKNNSV